MAMIGPYKGRQTCQECDGGGYQYRGTRQEYRPGLGLSAPENGRWVAFGVWVKCDICGGSGQITKATLDYLADTGTTASARRRGAGDPGGAQKINPLQ